MQVEEKRRYKVMKIFVPLYLLWEESVTFVSATINMH